MIILPKNYYHTAETHTEYVLYSDTDSLFAVVPMKGINKKPIEERNKIATELSENINESIQQYLNHTLLPKLNINPEHNTTFFKLEYIIDAIILLDIKKQYVTRVLTRKGKILSSPKIEYTGIQAIKKDVADMTKDIIKAIIEDIILAEKDNNKRLKRISEAIQKFYNEFLECCETWNVERIGIPGKYSRKQNIIEGMELYNKIVNKKVFAPGSAGYFVYCKQIYRNKDIRGICLPLKIDSDIKNILKENGIIIDKDEHWNRIMTTTIKRIIELVK